MKPDRLLVIIDKMAYPIHQIRTPILFDFLYENPKAQEELKNLYEEILK
jgi:hypothetical protein